MLPRHRAIFWLLLLGILCSATSYASAGGAILNARGCAAAPKRADVLSLARKKTKSKAKSGSRGPTKISPRGFGSAAKIKGGGQLLSEPRYEALYEWLRTNPLTNLHKVAVAEFDGLRGVMALQEIAAGEEIVGIPATFAVDLGSDSNDPLPAAQRLLEARAEEALPESVLADEQQMADVVEAIAEAGCDARAAYWATLPPPDSPDLCTPDFFSDDELEMLQWPPLRDEASQRLERIRRSVAAASSSAQEGSSSSTAATAAAATATAATATTASSTRDLQWAVWAVLSRVLTVQGPPESWGGPPVGRKLLIPFIDMFNHKGGTRHYLTGRTDGMLKVVAGSPVKAGEQIFIMYGTEATSNAEFVGHYGFHDPSNAAMSADEKMVRSIVSEGGQSIAEEESVMRALGTTSIAEDEALLAAVPAPPYRQQLAIQLRLSLKKAAARQGLLG